MNRFLIAAALTAVLLCGCADGTVTATPDTAVPVSATVEPPTAAPTAAPTEPPTEPPSPAEIAEQNLDTILSGKLKKQKASVEVPQMSQYPDLPSGCESVALTIAINSFGYQLADTDIADKYLVYGDSYVTSFVGDPHRYGGSGIYPPGLIKTVENFTGDTGAALYPFDTTSRAMDELYKLIEAGIPVVIWTTVYMNTPYFEDEEEYNGVTYPWYDTEHCVVLCGYNIKSDEVTISDPQRGKVTVSASDFADIYDTIGRFSMVLIPTEGAPQATEQEDNDVPRDAKEETTAKP